MLCLSMATTETRKERLMILTEGDRACMRLVIEKTQAAIESGNWPFGACIARAGQPLAVAHNLVLETLDPMAHAEIVAIRQACAQLGSTDLTGCDIYTSSAPCPMCFSAIYWSGIRRIVYGAHAADYGVLGFEEFAVPPEIMAEIGGIPMEIEAGFMRDENRALFDHYLSKYGKAF